MEVIFNVRGILKEGKKSCTMCFVGMKKAFDRVPRIMEWANKKKVILKEMI